VPQKLLPKEETFFCVLILNADWGTIMVQTRPTIPTQDTTLPYWVDCSIIPHE
jgi:hypothetical protein